MKKKERNESVTTPVVASVLEMLLILLQLCLIKKLAVTTMELIFKTVNLFFASPIIPNSKYMIDQLIYCREGLQYHAYCLKCNLYIDQFKPKTTNTKKMKQKSNKKEFGDLQCRGCAQKCNTKITKKSQHAVFVIFNIESQIAQLVEENSEYFLNVMQGNKSGFTEIRDIFNGLLYKAHVNKLPEEKREQYCTGILNTDGVPPYKNSKYSIWPIQIILNEIPIETRMKQPMIVGLWFGKSKPNLECVLKPLVQYLNQLSKDGVNVKLNNQKVNLAFNVICGCADSPARADMQGISYYSGYYSCPWCLIKGKYIKGEKQKKGSVKFPSLHQQENPKVRTRAGLMRHLEKTKKNNNVTYKGSRFSSPLLELEGFDIIHSFTPDYMHSICLGVTKTFAGYWFDSAKTPYYIPPATMRNLSDSMENIQPPSQLCRLSRPLEDRKFYKSREWENWLIYYSVPLLMTIPAFKIYLNHWILFVQAIRILLKDRISREDLATAHTLLVEFVNGTEMLYGAVAMTSNVHSLLHTVQSVIDWGPFWAHSGYPFESFNGDIKDMLHASQGAISQVCRRIKMKEAIFLLKKNITFETPKIEQAFDEFFKSQTLKTIKIGSTRYFGKEKKISEELARELQLNPTTTFYERMFKNNCKFASDRRKNQVRTNDSFALTSDGKFVQLFYFLVNVEENVEIAIVKNVTVSQCMHEDRLLFYKIVKIGENYDTIDSEKIERVSVCIEVGGNQFLSPTPHTLLF